MPDSCVADDEVAGQPDADDRHAEPPADLDRDDTDRVIGMPDATCRAPRRRNELRGS